MDFWLYLKSRVYGVHAPPPPAFFLSPPSSPPTVNLEPRETSRLPHAVI